MMEQMQKVADLFRDVSNEWKPRALIGKGMGTIFLQSTVRAPKSVPDKSELEELARKALRKREKSRQQSLTEDQDIKAGITTSIT